MRFCTRLLHRAWRSTPPGRAAMTSRIRLLALGIAGAVAACSQEVGQPVDSADETTAETATETTADIAPEVPEAASARPNILFIVADDLGYTDIGAFGSEIATPNLDELAFAGVRLTNFRTHRACQQTRVMMMASANVTEALEIRPTQPSRERANRLSLNWAIIPELLQDAGYETLHRRQVGPGSGRRLYALDPGIRSLLRATRRLGKPLSRDPLGRLQPVSNGRRDRRIRGPAAGFLYHGLLHRTG